MYQRRVKLEPEGRTFYLITNRVTGGSFIFGDLEKEHFRKLLLSKWSMKVKRFIYNILYHTNVKVLT